MTNIMLSVRHKLWRTAASFGAIIASVGLLFTFSGPMAAFAQSAQTNRQQLFLSAAQEFNVPENVLLALSYNESHWTSNVGMSSDGGYGLMDLRTYQGKIVSGRDGATVTPAKRPIGYYTLDQAATDYTTSSIADLRIRKGDVVTISPNFATNQPVVTDCQTSTCVTLPKQGANFVYLHTQPSNDAPLLTDPYLHAQVSSDPYLRVYGSAGNTQDNDWGDKAPSGFKYVVAGVQGDWTGVWYSGQVGWFYNPHGEGHTAHHGMSATLTPRPGLSSIPVYTLAYPEASAYPSVIPVQPQQTAYSMPAGQQYTTSGEAVTGDYFHDWTWNYSAPDDHMVVVGKQKYYEIIFNHHVGFVKVEDAIVTTN